MLDVCLTFSGYEFHVYDFQCFVKSIKRKYVRLDYLFCNNGYWLPCAETQYDWIISLFLIPAASVSVLVYVALFQGPGCLAS